MKKIKNIIFDFGGVIINIDYTKSINEFKKLGIKKSEHLYSKERQSNLFDLLEKGQISEDEFLTILKKLTKKKDEKKIKDAWNSMLLDIPVERIHLLNKIKSKYKLYLLSNTNEIHIKEIKKRIGNKNWIQFVNLFNNVYLSYEVKLRKPEQEIFKCLLEKEKINAEETLFIDDSIQHIKSAQKLNIHSYHLKDNENITKLFSDKFQLKHH